MRITCKTKDTLTLEGLTEEWRDVKDYEGLYQVSNLGRVMSLPREVYTSDGILLRRTVKRILKIRKNTSGVRITNFSTDDVKKTFVVARLVAEAFVPNPNNLPFVMHKDDDKNNNHFDNLQWCEKKEYVNYFYKKHIDTRKPAKIENIKRVRQQTEGYKKAKLKLWKQIVATSLSTGERIYFKSATYAKEFGFNNKAICNCLKNKVKSHKGYKWEYVKNN